MNVAREHLLQIFQAALTQVQGELCTQRALSGRKLTNPLAVIAIGKAASSMMLGAVSALRGNLKAGLLIAKEGHGDIRLQAMKNMHCLESAHPVPDQRSLQAGQTLLDFLEGQSAEVDFLFLISGGASALVEVLPAALRLDDLQRVNEWLLGSGWDIVAMNHMRQSLSCIKGGRLALKLVHRNVRCLMISDVPGDSPQIIGSGLLSRAKDDASLPTDIPGWLAALPKAPPAPLANDVCFETIEISIIATLKEAMQAAKEMVVTLGYDVFLHEGLLSGEAQHVGQQLARELCDGDVGLHIWGGETTVRLPEEPGRGGRNQQLALAAAAELSGNQHCWFLSAGTDGSDGSTQDAGALVDGLTVQRGNQSGFDVHQTLTIANAGEFLHASGDLIITGPTGTNVMDLVLAIKLPAT